ncbi:GNAT family N-acetyltransferase [Variovorax sp. J22R133]|uniref:GNAT family N-acetyltransferase n=1 Tax=Variovorax brevis TaxID=3053503 RepID=UPI0025790208|nr:GNAT family N-acetyltransferase [Variovorax sp. J22R133]MDM0111465.1 GNAT family N-acetyltransferase [Variovorax sp. J22R133]
MPTPINITTERLHLRQWRDADREPFAALNADPLVRRYFAATLSREESDREMDAWRSSLDSRGWSNWAVETRDSGAFIGFIGLTIPKRALPFTPCVELGYRLAREHWGKGYATEGARAALRVGFEHLALEEIVSFTSLLNLPSRAVMERVGMTNANEDFDYPAFPKGSALGRHCLYRLSRETWLRKCAAGE